jgi:hypothetical protein
MAIRPSVHRDHEHQHGPGCGHKAVKHNGHSDYLHDGHLHHVTAEGVVEHQIEASSLNPTGCTPKHNCDGHQKDHEHGPACSHPAVPHADHVDYLVNDHLHHPHDGHCDDHGKLEIG